MEARFSVMFARANTRKHKKWEGDGFLNIFPNGECELVEEGGRELSRSSLTAKKRAELCEGYIMMVGGYEVEVQEETAVEEVKLPSPPIVTRPRPAPPSSLLSPATPKLSKITPSPLPSFPSKKRPFQPVQLEPGPCVSPESKKKQCPSLLPPPILTGLRKPFCSPLVGAQEKYTPLVLNPEEVERGEAPCTLDGILARFLRDHQREGVEFLFRRLKDRGGGAILADEMGLGKSIQTIATCWALLSRKSTIADTVSKCLLVVPSSLLNNWRAEFTKWFRGTRSPALIVRRAADIVSYKSAYKCSPFLVVSYDMALRSARSLESCQFDVIVCDEGHRLKNLSGKLREALVSLTIPRRLLLTGTPIQNDLDELYSLLDFVKPGRFGTPQDFRSRCRTGDGEESDTVGEVQSAIGDIMLRRTSEVNKAHLPPKHEYVFFCAPSELQRKIFEAIADHVTGDPLVLIDYMRKASNHPAILYKHLQKGADDGATANQRISYSTIAAVYPRDYGSRSATITESGKLSVLAEMLNSFRHLTECTVVVSQYTKSLDMISVLCSSLGFTIFRLDGQTAVADRQRMVDAFNTERKANNVFLLSSKAGGVGLNLIGASRLVLFDMDWNPASDMQGAIDEKILQRQCKKTGLATVIDGEGMAQGGEKLSFRDEDLADIFTLKETSCDTHDLLQCDCGGSGLLPLEREEEQVDCRLRDEGIDEDDIFNSMTVEEGIGEEEEEDEEKMEREQAEEQAELPGGPVSMAELFRWRHYGPQDAEAWKHLKCTAGVGSAPTAELTFAFHYTATI